MNERDKLLTDSTLPSPTKFRNYSVGRVIRLRDLGNPFFGGDGEDWKPEEIVGTAWVAFTRDVEELSNLCGMENPRAAIAAIWEEEMHADDFQPTWEWMQKEARMTTAAQTEAMPEAGAGKSEPSAPVAQVPTS